uniref:Uncharacterized protein n=1 Tax=Timspurckia oligopyrenoides TaxID=708627 RepID=A0A7S0ZCK9_9RHOD|mmetsp:Transcript_12486/g.22549  ORF Transcript_12486/g.22549 Transcript_12486/m.22549 type:complete len:217 (+) Transcript_12486:98-748(+)
MAFVSFGVVGKNRVDFGCGNRNQFDIVHVSKTSFESRSHKNYYVISMAGFGKSDSGKGKTVKKQKTIAREFSELASTDGFNTYVVHAKSADSESMEWMKVGLIVSQEADIHKALLKNKRSILEHAKDLFPILKVSQDLELGFSVQSEDANASITKAERVDRAEALETQSAWQGDPDLTKGSYYRPSLPDGRAKPIDTSSGSVAGPRSRGQSKTPSE